VLDHVVVKARKTLLILRAVDDADTHRDAEWLEASCIAQQKRLLGVAVGENFKGERLPGLGVDQASALQNHAGLGEQRIGRLLIDAVLTAAVADRELICALEKFRTDGIRERGKKRALTGIGRASGRGEIRALEVARSAFEQTIVERAV